MPDDSFKRWVEDKVRELGEQGWAPGGPREERILETWRRVRPRMCRRLGPALLVKLAFVLDNQRFEAKKAYLKAGWPPCDAEEQATREWLLLEPEDDSAAA